MWHSFLVSTEITLLIFSAESNHPPLFTLSPHLVCPEKEIEYLQHVSEVFIMFLLPRSYSLSPAKYFLREVLAFKGKGF